MRKYRGAAALVTTGLFVWGGVAAAVAVQNRNEAERQMGEQEDGSYQVSSSQTLTPAGVVQKLDGTRPKDLAVSPDGKTIAVLTQNSLAFFDTKGTPQGRATVEAGPLGIAWTPDGNAVYAALSRGRVARVVRDKAGTSWEVEATITLNTVGAEGTPDVAAGVAGRGAAQQDPQVTGLAVSANGSKLFAAMGIRNAVAVMELPGGKISRVIPVGVAPYHLALSPDGKTLCAANRGGRAADKNEPSATSAGTPVRVDKETDAAKSGSISFVDTQTFAVVSVEAGRQPSGMAFAGGHKTLYVASSDDDTLLVLDIDKPRLRRTLPLRPAGQTDNSTPDYGQIPTAVAVGDTNTVYVACGGANAVAVVDVNGRKPTAYLPTGWFPIAIAQRDGAVFVASSKGVGSRVKRAEKGGKAASYGVHNTVGMVQFLSPTVLANAGAATNALVARNNRAGELAAPTNARVGRTPVPVPERRGEPSVFQHVIYIIKENQTYDDILGDVKEGRGEPSLCLFGENVTPNHHVLAREFVLLDNTYTSGTNSADGHQWTVSGMGNGYIEQNYAAHARSYPYDGGDPLAYSPRGFLWTQAVKAKKSVRVYGEFVNRPRIVNRQTGKKGGTWGEIWRDYQTGMKNFDITPETDNAALRPYLHPRYIGFPTTVPDQWRADQFIADVDNWEKTGVMPALSIMLLPADHTMGTRPGVPTPRAAVADNDLALGRIVERVSKSRFWKNTLILVIEDDSQLGVDHIDGHRTVAFCISPYTRRGAVVHDSYNHTSFLQTIERVLGLPAMNRFDRTATPLTACFTQTPDVRPYRVRPANIPLDEMNPALSTLRGEARRLAQASAQQDWSDVDRADNTVVSRAVWSIQKPGVPFPKNYKPALDDDDD